MDNIIFLNARQVTALRHLLKRLAANVQTSHNAVVKVGAMPGVSDLVLLARHSAKVACAAARLRQWTEFAEALTAVLLAYPDPQLELFHGPPATAAPQGPAGDGPVPVTIAPASDGPAILPLTPPDQGGDAGGGPAGAEPAREDEGRGAAGTAEPALRGDQEPGADADGGNW